MYIRPYALLICNIFQQFPKCSEGNLTIYEGYKQLGEKTGEFCGSDRPLWSLISRTNSLTLHVKKTPYGFFRFSATWKKQPSA